MADSPRAEDRISGARIMWTLFEPVHAVTYFAPEALSAFEDAGLRGFWRGYFAGRSAPLGPVGAAVVTASFYNFAPAFVARAIPAVWDLISPQDALRVRMDGAVAALDRLLAGQEAQVAAAADQLGQAVSDLDCAGRVLAAGNAALPVPAGDLGRLWHAATLLREHRGDGHFAALTAADIDGCEAVVLRCAKDLRRADMQRVRGWTDEQWDAARARLAARGWIAEDGQLTDTGAAAHAAVEDATDAAAARPWTHLGPQATAELADLLTPIAQACAKALPYPSPVGVPAPGTLARLRLAGTLAFAQRLDGLGQPGLAGFWLLGVLDPAHRPVSQRAAAARSMPNPISVAPSTRSSLAPHTPT